MKTLITGAGGNIGRCVTEALAMDHEVIAIGSRAGSVFSRPEIMSHTIDISKETDKLEEIIAGERPDAIVHLAALVGGICSEQPREAYAINVKATQDLATLAVGYGVSKFIFASSASVYDQLRLLPTRENEYIGAKTIYGYSKLMAEVAIDAQAREPRQTSFTTLRIFNVYGHGMSHSLIERLRTSTAANPVPLFGKDNFYRDYVHVDDIATAVVRACDYDQPAPHTIMNIASGVTTSNGEVLQAMVNSGLSPHYQNKGEPAIPEYSWANIEVAQRLLGFEPNTELVFDR